MEETKKLLVARDQVCYAETFIHWKNMVKEIFFGGGGGGSEMGS